MDAHTATGRVKLSAMSESSDPATPFAATAPAGLPIQATIVFADLCGSTGLFETLGNERATKAVTRITDWMGESCRAHGGTLIKTLGDGALMRFDMASDAVSLCVELQRRHEERILKWPEPIRARLQVGLASGQVVDVQGDCFGDAVNVASRLAGMSGAGQIWADAPTMEALPAGHSVRSRSLGAVTVRGKADAQTVYLVEWAEQLNSSILTVQAGFQTAPSLSQSSVLGGFDLSWLDLRAHFRAEDGAVLIGRDESVQFPVQDSRVSRQHARIEWQTTPSGGHFVLTDLSSFGTWVRFAGSSQEIELRRNRCTLSGNGEIALGAPFSDFSVPTVQFSLGASELSVARRWR